ncbi:MAG: AAA family ATPase [Pirellulaceae bacterium]
MNDSALLETPAADEAAANSPVSQTVAYPFAPPAGESFFPQEPATMEEAGLSPTDVEALILKQLLIGGAATGRKVAEQIRLPFGVMQGLLRGLKQQLLVNYKSQASMGDFEHELTQEGEKRARWYVDRCTYCGSAPVPLREYVRSIERQSIKKVRPKLSDLMNAFSDLSLPPATISQVGQAIYSGHGLFLYGQPGNGKTSIAERVIRAVSQTIWVPRTITITGEIIRVFDPANHEEVAPDSSGNLLELSRYDRRWVQIKRPSIIVGGELRMEQLEVTSNSATGIIESPLQMKANGGALVVDDFGRQRMSTADLLNRWIVPLEKGVDYLSLPSGRQIQVPFDPILIFSTNIDPSKLVDEAFLRRIPYKIEVLDPSPHEFRDLVKAWCGKLGVECQDDAVEYLMTRHYGEASRPFRYCHPRDLLLQVKTFCEFHELPLVLTTNAIDVAVKNYFAGL